MKVSELERCVRILCDYAASQGVDTVTFPGENYWTVGYPEWMEATEPELCVGSFPDDVRELEEMLSDPARGATALDLERVAHVLKRLSDQIASG